ncbi:hypothetical protein N836_24455 [Leptolyngbya sp. Heron Island J]|nr:hypothetical protein N836_24455 [Leptolyngbya sp. Heron Island J]
MNAIVTIIFSKVYVMKAAILFDTMSCVINLLKDKIFAVLKRNVNVVKDCRN